MVPFLVKSFMPFKIFRKMKYLTFDLTYDFGLKVMENILRSFQSYVFEKKNNKKYWATTVGLLYVVL